MASSPNHGPWRPVAVHRLYIYLLVVDLNYWSQRYSNVYLYSRTLTTYFGYGICNPEFQIAHLAAAGFRIRAAERLERDATTPSPFASAVSSTLPLVDADQCGRIVDIQQITVMALQNLSKSSSVSSAISCLQTYAAN